MHQPMEPVALTRTELEDAITRQRAIMKRAPQVMSARYHEQIDRLLDAWVTACLEETLAEEA